MSSIHSNTEISKSDSIKIALSVKDNFYTPRRSYKTSLFLCGADMSDPSKLRFKLSEAFSDWFNKLNYDLVFPEDIFDELLYGKQGRDLLSLENLLADSIDVIIIIPESPGSFTELGAFANDENLRKKIICLVDEKYKKNRSFINQGPIKLVKKVNSQGVIYIDPNNLDKYIKKIQSSIREVKKSGTTPSSGINLLQLDHFLMPVIYLLEPITKEIIITSIEAVTNDPKNSFQIATTVIGMLTKKKYIELTSFGYKITKLGMIDYFSFKTTSRYSNQNDTVALDNLRLEIINLKLRNKKLKI